MNRVLAIFFVVLGILIVVVGIIVTFTVFKNDLNKLISGNVANTSNSMGSIDLSDAQYGTVIGTSNVLYIGQVIRAKIQFPTDKWKAYVNSADTNTIGAMIVEGTGSEFVYTVTESDSTFSSIYFYVIDSVDKQVFSKSNRFVVKPKLEVISAPGIRDSLNSIRVGTPVEFQLNVQPSSWLKDIEVRSYNYDYTTKVVSTQAEVLKTSYADGVVIWNAPEHYIDQYYIFEIAFSDTIRKNRYIDDVFVRTSYPILVEGEPNVTSTSIDVSVSTGSIQSAQMMDRTGLTPHTMFVNDILRVRFRFNTPVLYIDVYYRDTLKTTEYTKLIQGSPVINDEISFFMPPLDYGTSVEFKCIDSTNGSSYVVLRPVIVDSYWELTFDKEDGFITDFFASSTAVWTMIFPVIINGFTNQYKDKSKWGFKIKYSDGKDFVDIPGFEYSTVAISLVNYGSNINSYAIRLDFTSLLTSQTLTKLSFEFSFDGGKWIQSPEVYSVKLLTDNSGYVAGESLSGITGLDTTVRCGNKLQLSYTGSHYGTSTYPAPVNWLLSIPTDEVEETSTSIFNFSKPGYRTILIGQTQGENRSIIFTPPTTYSAVDCQLIVYLVDNPLVYFKSNFFSILPSLFILEDSTDTPTSLTLTPQSNVVWYISGPGAEALTDGIDLFEFWYKSTGATEWSKLSGTNSLSALTPSKQVKLTWYFNPPSSFKTGTFKIVSKIITKEEVILNKTINVVSNRTAPNSYTYFNTLRYKSLFSDHFVPNEVIELSYSSGELGKIYNVYDISDYDNPVLVKLATSNNRSKEFIKIPANKSSVRYGVGLNSSTMIAEMSKSVNVYHIYGYKNNTHNISNKAGDPITLSFYVFSSDTNATPYWSITFDDGSKFNLKSRKKDYQDAKFTYIKYIVELPNTTAVSEKQTFNITAKNLTNSLSFAIVV
jgi:hypothetical protein